MIRRRDSSSLALLAGFVGGFAGAGAIALSAITAHPDTIASVQADAIMRLTQWASESINSVLDTIPEEMQPWLGTRWYDSDAPASWISEAPAPVPQRVVVLIHGLDEPGGIWDQLAPALEREGHAIVRFEYPNDQRIAPSAHAFAQALEELRAMGVEQIDIVAHSMGGLVAREVLSNPALYTDQLPSTHRLITLGTPHLGSPWSRMRAVAEIREQAQRWIESSDHDPKRLLGFARDGVGQAGTDLLPGSDFLETLNSRSMPQGLAVTCIVGRAVPFRATDPRALAGSGILERVVGERDAAAIEQGLETMKTELGDGVVPVSSAVMPGATDIVIVDANHRSMIRAIELDEAIKKLRGTDPAPTPPAIRVILDRLGGAENGKESPDTTLP